MFTTDATVIEIGMHMMTLMAPAYAVYVFIEVYSGALRGTGDVLVPMLMTCGGVRTQSAVGLVHRSAQAGHRHHPLQLSNRGR